MWAGLIALAILALLVWWIVRWMRAGGARRTVAIVAAVLLVLFVAQRLVSPGDEREIERVIETAATSEDVSYCTELLTDSYLEQTWGAPAEFADDLCEANGGAGAADSVDVLGVDIDGDRATALTERTGGTFNRSTVEQELVRTDGEWKLNRLLGFGNFDRAAWERAYGESFAEFGATEAGVACILRQLGRLSDIELERLLVSSSVLAFDRITVRCDRPLVERALLASFSEPEYESYPPEAVRCVRNRLEAAPEDELAGLFTDLIAWGRIVLACDPEAPVRELRESLSEEDDLDDETVDCAILRLRELSADELIRTNYDQDAYAQLLEDCGA